MPDSAATISIKKLTERIADREKLSGERRRRFVELLAAGHERDLAQRRKNVNFSTVMMLIVAPFLTLPAFLELPGFQWRWFHTAGVILFAFFSVVMHFVRRRAISRAIEFRDFELEWQDYCKWARPILIESSPGLLDRNLPEAR